MPIILTTTSIKITETRGIIQFGTAVINTVEVQFCYDHRNDRFTSIVYDVYKASRNFPEVHNQIYLVGRQISKSLKAL